MVVGWWSGGITSAVACKVAIDMYGVDNCRVIMMDTQNEHEDTYRFMRDCSKWYGIEIEVITALGGIFKSIKDIWRHHLSLNVAHGAICSSTLKRDLRVRWERENEYTHQVFGFEFNSKEFKRALGLASNYPKSKPIFPLLHLGYDKAKCIEIVQEAGIEPPEAYKMGLHNNNCVKSGCVQGGIGYWQLMRGKYPQKFDDMAALEHELTDLKGEPVTMLKDQSNAAKESGNTLVFLKKHPDYPNLKCISDMKGRPVKPLMDCNGFCGTNDLLPKNETEQELNYGD